MARVFDRGRRVRTPDRTRAGSSSPSARAGTSKRATRAKTSSGAARALWVIPLVAVAFFAGRESADWTATRPSDLSPPRDVDTAGTSEIDREGRDPSSAVFTGTTTEALCPCPKPRSTPQKLAIKRQPTAARPTSGVERSDPTGETAAFLRARAHELSRCAPRSGGEVRVHLEVTVLPSGLVERVRVTNLEGAPASVSECVEGALRGLNAPGFDAMSSETFALTVVL
jgi:hypothetical protein